MIPRSPIALAAAATLCGGCGLEEWRNADLQVDVLGAELGEHPDEVRARICVEGAGNAEEALGAGKIGFPGLPAGEPLTITIDTLVDDVDGQRGGRAGPVTLDAQNPYTSVSWESCAGEDCPACVASGTLAAEGDEDWLLAVRLVY